MSATRYAMSSTMLPQIGVRPNFASAVAAACGLTLRVLPGEFQPKGDPP